MPPMRAAIDRARPPARSGGGRRWIPALVALAVVALSACQATIRPSGTTIAPANAPLRIVVPAGAVLADTALTYDAVADPPSGSEVVVGTTFDLAPARGWREPIDVTIGYRPADLPPGVAEGDLQLVRFARGSWTVVEGSTVDPAADSVSARTRVLGRLAVASGACDPAAPSSCPLRPLADRAGLRLGATLGPEEAVDPGYAGTLAREFNALTPENALKMYATQNERGVWTFAAADAVVAFAEEHGMEVRGHTLVWGQDQFTPAWVKAITDPEELQQVTAEQIETVMTRYRGRIHRWDVVNEPLATLGTARAGSVWDDLLGPGWVADAFRTAHRVDPDAELWLNEYGTDWVPGKHQALLALVAELVADGVPIHGVGLQTHRISVAGPDRAAFEQQLRDYAALGLEVAITELDVVTSPTDPQAAVKQAEAYRRILDACLAVAACREVTTWGVTDASTWLDAQGIFPPPTRPLLFDEHLAPKPAYDAMRSALAAQGP